MYSESFQIYVQAPQCWLGLPHLETLNIIAATYFFVYQQRKEKYSSIFLQLCCLIIIYALYCAKSIIPRM